MIKQNRESSVKATKQLIFSAYFFTAYNAKSHRALVTQIRIKISDVVERSRYQTVNKISR